MLNGFFLVDKPRGMTSFEVVKELRKRLAFSKGLKPSSIKVGHSGTLDRLATGLLIVGVGEGCKLLEFLIGCDKEYEVLAYFGAVSDTYDEDGKITPLKDLNKKNFDGILKKLPKIISENFLGEILQVPPKFSALKVQGRRASDRARAGEEVNLSKREVTIFSFDLLDFTFPTASFRIKCSSGTYVRSLIHDLGQKLSCGAYVKELRRTMIDDFSVQDAVSLDNIDVQKIVSLEYVARHFQFLTLNSDEFDLLRDGKILKNKKIEQGCFAMAFYENRLVGVLENADSGVKYRKVIHHD
ncbi:tRNA pseudouridine(55) synthase TruB [Candidatus Peregrinibacteria bacterium]|nr:tRNA pseudouridine(55) synthase TruB [Candidatus Peregrinibacteria bacterium]